MEPITIFAGSVGVICGCHVLFSMAEFFGKGRYYAGQNPAKCDEWYCFFKLEDLLGKQHDQSVARTDLHQVDHRRRQQRPRLHV